jgi:hypothetical protein
MSVYASWNITITLRDGSQINRSQAWPYNPVRGSTINDKVNDGKPIIALIDTFHHQRAKVAGLGEWQIAAIES